MLHQSLRICYVFLTFMGMSYAGVSVVLANEDALDAGGGPMTGQLTLTTGEIPKDGDGVSVPGSVPSAGQATDPVSYLSPIARLPQPEIDALVARTEEALQPYSAGWNLRSRVVLLAGSDLRAVRALVEFARTAPSGVVSDIGAGLENAARDAVGAGSAAYGQRIQEIIAAADVPQLNEAYAVAERRGILSPATAALGTGGSTGGGFSAGSVTGGNDGAAGGTGPFGGDRTVPTTMGSYPIYGNSGSFGETTTRVLSGNTGDASVSPAD